MWGYLNQRISTWMAMIIIVLFGAICVMAVRGYANIIIKEIDRAQKFIQAEQY